MVVNKFIGAGLILGGLAMMFVFPDWHVESAYQPKGFAHSSIVIGLVMVVVGAYLVLV